MEIWILFALIAMLATTISIIVHKYISLYTTNSNHLVILTTFLFLGLYSLIYIIYNNKEYKKFFIDKNIVQLITLSFIISLSITIYNLCINKAIKTSKNISYCNLIINCSIILTAIIGTILFKEKLNIYSLIGILLCFFGFNFILYGKNIK